MQAEQVGTLDRQRYIGGSDVAAVLGLSKWMNATPLRTYMKKLGLVDLTEVEDDPRRDKILRRGKRMEPVILNTLRDEFPIKITRASTEEEPNRYQDGEHPFLAAEIDFEWEVTQEMVDALAEFNIDIPLELVGTVQNGEIKSHHPFAFKGQYGEQGTDEIPIEYGCQAWHGLGVTGRDLTLFVVMVGTDDLNLYCMRRDDRQISNIRDRMVAFWKEYVLKKIPPPPINQPDVWTLMRSKPESVAVADEKTSALFKEWLLIKDQAKAYAEQEKELTFVLTAYMVGYGEAKSPKAKTAGGKHELRDDTGELLLSSTLQEQVRIDNDALRAKHPEAATECEKTIRFYATRKKGARS